MLRHLKFVGLSLLSGILLWLSWFPNGFFPLIFIAFVPLFLMSDKLLFQNKGLTFWQGTHYSFWAFLIWNVGVTWWIVNSTAVGAVAAFVLNSFFMSLVFGLWHWCKKRVSYSITAALLFIAFWCSFEFLHLHWDLNWSWLNLGNVFAPYPKIIQWYEFTGAFGGTIWILIVNFLVLHTIKNYKNWKYYFSTFLAIFIPILISLIIYKTYKIETESGVEVVIVQQNIDPWEEQYKYPNEYFAALITEIAKPQLSENTDVIVCSESAIPHTINEFDLYNKHTLSSNKTFAIFDSLIVEYPKINLIFGLSTVQQFNNKATSTCRNYREKVYLDFYNSACLYNNQSLQLYRKCKLVPGVEKMPFPKLLGFLDNLVIDLGGASGSLGVDTFQRAFQTSVFDNSMKIGAPVCFESIFGELFGNFVNNGAQVMCVITNDSWWGRTPGYKQLFELTKLRAIESRRYIIRAANAGISAFIDPLGNAHQQTQYETRTAIKQIVYLNPKITFYTKYGDYLARLMLFVSFAGLVFSIWKRRPLNPLKGTFDP